MITSWLIGLFYNKTAMGRETGTAGPDPGAHGGYFIAPKKTPQAH